MIVTWIFVGLAGCLLASTLHYRRKWKDAFDEKEATDRIYIPTSKHRYDLLVLCHKGHESLMVHDYKSESPLALASSFVAVIGTLNGNVGNSFIVKKFYYDKNDPSDREFAIREAEELIETIQKF